MFSRARPEPDTEVAQCPVCRGILGKRDKTVIFKAHCPECRATFWWKSWADKPSVVLDSYKPNKGYCGPSGCICRD